jgi:phenylalanyl-tRNA synthetase beta chain
MSSSILLNNREVGFMGSLHPKFLENLGFKQDIFIFSFEVENLKDKSLTSFKQFSKFPSTSRDLAFLISKETSAASIQKIIESSAGDFFKGIKIFDVYQGKGIPEDKKSIALSVSWQSMEQTLVDSDIDNVIEKIVNSVKEELDGELRV